MRETATQFLERLIQAKIVRPLQDAEARFEIRRLDQTQGRQPPYPAVSEALLNAGAITPYQAKKLRRNRPEELLYGPYVVLDELGQGGMGVVLRAWHKVLDRIDALKTITAERLQNDPQAVERFRREARLLARIEHPHVVRAYFADYDEPNDRHYLAMEHIEGPNLSEFIDRAKPKRLTLRRACDFAMHAALGLARLHQEGIVHRDVKPGNLILVPDGTVKLLDMGLARYSEPDRGPNFTASGQIFGSPQYMSPEQCACDRDLDARSDIYSLGGSLYYFCTGLSMFESRCGKNMICYIDAHQKTSPPALREVRPDAPEPLDAIFRKMTAKRPDDRYRTMNDVVDALRRVRDQFDSAPPSASRSGIATAPVADAGVASASGSKRQRKRQEGAKPGEERDDNELRLPLLWRPEGSFLMGSPQNEPDRRDNEDQTDVRLARGCWLGKFPVTQSQWRKLMGSSVQDQARLAAPAPTVAGEGPNHPMHYVSYGDAQEFCRELAEREHAAGRLPTGWEYRLPTEAEWEHACRAGATTATAFGDDLSAYQANFDGDYPYRGAEKGPVLGRTSAAGGYAPNSWGFYDMHGNVYEWCLDWYQAKLPGGDDPIAPAEGALLRSVRGGDWRSAGLYCRSANRGRCDPEQRLDSLGFRIALAPSLAKPAN